MEKLFGFDWGEVSWGSFSASMITAIIIFAILSIFFIVMGIVFKHMDPKTTPVPTKGLKFLCVVLVDTINKFVVNNLGKENRKLYSSYFIGVASFLSLANISSIVGLNPPYANLGIALSLSIIAFIIFQFTGFKFQGVKGRIEGFMGPVKGVSFLVFPISIIGEFTTPFSMGMRMFGNLFSGLVISGIVFALVEILGGLLGTILSGVVGSLLFIVLHAIFDIFFGLLQMYVYVMLTTMFVKQNM